MHAPYGHSWSHIARDLWAWRHALLPVITQSKKCTQFTTQRRDSLPFNWSCTNSFDVIFCLINFSGMLVLWQKSYCLAALATTLVCRYGKYLLWQIAHTPERELIVVLMSERALRCCGLAAITGLTPLPRVTVNLRTRCCERLLSHALTQRSLETECCAETTCELSYVPTCLVVKPEMFDFHCIIQYRKCAQ